jgi:hypothetical protein
MKWRKQYHTVWTIPKPNRKIVERGKNITHNTQVQDRSYQISFIYAMTNFQNNEMQIS